MVDFFVNNFDNCLWLTIIIIAMTPTLEGRIAIPFALTISQIHPILALFLAFLGSIIPCLPIIYLIRITRNKKGFLHNKISTIFSEKYSSNLVAINNNKLNIKKLIALSFFVAIPLPMTGVWSGSIIAGFSNLNIWQCFLSISIGSLFACGIILLVGLLFGNKVIYFLIISLIIITGITMFEFFKFILKKRKSK